MSSLFEAYITNLGKYNEGRLVGETLKFPATTEEVQSLLKRIGVDGVRYEEIFITSFDGDVLGLYSRYGMKVVWMALARSYNSSSIASQKPRESVPDRTIFIPMVANTSEKRAAESIKSSISVTSSMNTYS